MFMGLVICPKLHVLFVDISTHVKMGSITEQNQVDNNLVLNTFTNTRTKFDLFFFLHQLVFMGFAPYYKETILSHYWWFFAYLPLRCQLFETVVLSIFVVIVQYSEGGMRSSEGSLPEHSPVFWQQRATRHDLFCRLPHC